MTTVYHNPRCSKSRCSLEYLNSKGVEYTVVKYLETPPTVEELAEIVRMLAIRPEELVRKGEDLFKSQYKGKIFSDEQWIQLMVQNPSLIERPIVISNGKAVVARPVEKIDAIL